VLQVAPVVRVEYSVEVVVVATQQRLHQRQLLVVPELLQITLAALLLMVLVEMVELLVVTAQAFLVQLEL